MTTTRLLLYNDALSLVGERRLASVTEAREPRYLLDAAWDSGAVDYCLQQGQWNFAIRSIKLEYSPSVQPTFGYRRAFDKPSDCLRTSALCSDEYFKIPLLEYTDEAFFWFSDLDVIYVKYVSNDASYGGHMATWPPVFAEYVSTFLASKIAPKLTTDETKRKNIDEELKRTLRNARAKDAMDQPTSFAPQSSWVSARGGRGWRRDGGNRGSLIG